jgi:hypothetical protein
MDGWGCPINGGLFASLLSPPYGLHRIVQFVDTVLTLIEQGPFGHQMARLI